MIVREHIALGTLTTFRIGGPARYIIDIEHPDEIPDALSFASEHGLPWYALGAGSNVLADDAGYDGVVLHPIFSSHSFDTENDGTLLTVEAGASWDDVVNLASERELWGIENLAGIPGTIGAAPVQNIGAYGAELADTLAWVDAFDAASGAIRRFSKEECELGYRTSRFKKDASLIIVRAALRLSATPAPRLSYADLARRKNAGEALGTPREIAQAVRAIRAKKFPDLSVSGTAGSFFKNPFIPAADFDALKERYPELPGFPAGAMVKVPLAWILDHVLSLRGFAHGTVRLFESQPLVIVAEEGATSREVEALAREVAEKVSDATGIAVEWEARKLP